MTDVYVPWPERGPKRFRGPAKVIAALAVALYRVFAPPVRRLAGLIFIGGVVGACLLAWGVAVLMRTAGTVQRHLVATGTASKGEWISLDTLRQGVTELSLSVPAWLLWPVQSLVVRDIIAVVGVVSFVSLVAMFAIWWERKTAGHIQSRLGPMRVGGWHGWSQSMADGIKCIAKEDFIPDRADKPLFRLAPYLSFVPVVMAFLALPFGVYWVFRELDVALLMILALLGVDVMGVLIGGWASNNKWSVYGAMRVACQVVSYEIPMGMTLLVPVMVAGTMQLSKVAEFQQGGWFNWLAWHSPWTFAAMLVYFIASLAACKRAPFDLPEAESELVAGFHTEYSGFRWAVFFFAEYATMFLVSGLLVILFLGAWDAPWVGLAPVGWAEGTLWQRLAYGVVFSGPIWFVLKCMFFIYVQLWLRWTLPRLRIDQVLYSCVQVMLPLAMVVLLCNVFWELWLPADAPPPVYWIPWAIRLVLGVIGAIGAVGVLYVAYVGFSKRRVLVGTQAVNRPLAGG